jgi:hypothetical protein
MRIKVALTAIVGIFSMLSLPVMGQEASIPDNIRCADRSAEAAGVLDQISPGGYLVTRFQFKTPYQIYGCEFGRSGPITSDRAEELERKLNEQFPSYRWRVTLADCDPLLRIDVSAIQQ